MLSDAEAMPIAVVEQETGLSKDVLRKWEARYAFPVPERNARGDRLYSRDQVERLRAVKRLMDAGHRPAQLFALDAAGWAGLLAANASLTRAVVLEAGSADVPALLALLRAHQPAAFRAALRRSLQEQGLRRFVQDTMAPLSVAVGEAWALGELGVFEEHLYSEVATALLTEAREALDNPGGRPRVLMTTLPGEAHAIGLMMAACLFTLGGAHCLYLGTQMPAGDIALAVAAHAPDIVAISFSSAYPARQVLPALRDLRQRIPVSTGIVAGGGGLRRHRAPAGVAFMRDLAEVDALLAGKTAS